MDGESCILTAGKEESESEDSDDDDFDEKPALKKRAPAVRPSSAGNTGKAKAGPQLKKAKGQVCSSSLQPLITLGCWPGVVVEAVGCCNLWQTATGRAMRMPSSCSLRSSCVAAANCCLRAQWNLTA